jgi:hypothetical protein
MVQKFSVSKLILGCWGKPEELLLNGSNSALQVFCGSKQGNFNASDEIFPEFVLEKCKIRIPIARQKIQMNGLELVTSLKIPQ